MKLKEIITLALTYLGDEDAADGNLVNNSRLETLARCANIVIKEIATDYLPLEANERVEVKDGRISYDAFSHRLLEVLSVKNADTDIKSNFRHTPSALEVMSGDIKRADVKYCYLPKDVGMDGECEISPLVGAKTAAMGVCAEYSLIEGLYEQSTVFSERFKEDLRCAVRKKGEIRIKPRRWC